jgi:Cyanobacterial TRADD-N associated 2-Transmembrane domain
VAAIEKYVTQTRIQAELSFRLSKRVAVWAFVLIAAGVVLSIYSAFFKKGDLTPAVVATLAGVFTQLISGVFFYLYNRTLQQFNLFGDKISAAQRLAMSLLVNGSISGSVKRDDSSASLATALLHAGIAPASASPSPQPSPAGPGGA